MQTMIACTFDFDGNMHCMLAVEGCVALSNSELLCGGARTGC